MISWLSCEVVPNSKSLPILLLFVVSVASAGCSSPEVNDGVACELPKTWTVQGGLLAIPGPDGINGHGIMSMDEWVKAGTHTAPPCGDALAILSQEGLANPTKAFSTSLSWVVPLDVPPSRIQEWYRNYTQSHRIKVVVDETFGYLQCNPIFPKNEQRTGQSYLTYKESALLCLELDLLGQGAGFWPGTLDGLWPLYDRPTVLSEWYKFGYWAGRVAFYILASFALLIIIGIGAAIFE